MHNDSKADIQRTALHMPVNMFISFLNKGRHSVYCMTYACWDVHFLLKKRQTLCS